MAESGFERPTLSELIERITGDLNSRLTGEDTRVRFNPLNVLSRAFAGLVHLLHGNLEWISRQVLPDTADEDILARHAEIRGVPRLLAEYASLDSPAGLTFTGTNGTAIPSGAEVQRLDDGLTYTTTAAGVISGGTVTLPILATAAGADYNSVSGTLFTLTTPIAGVDSEATLSADMVNGADLEPVDDWRARILQRWQDPPQGGSEADYIEWAQLVEAVNNVYVIPNELGLGTVGVRFTVDATVSADIVPDAAEIAAVQASIDAEKPVAAAVYVYGDNTGAGVAIADPQTFDITVTPNSAEVQTAIRNELDQMFIRLSEPGGTIYESQYRAAISAAAGETHHTVNSPAGNIVAASANHVPMITDPNTDITFTP